MNNISSFYNSEDPSLTLDHAHDFWLVYPEKKVVRDSLRVYIILSIYLLVVAGQGTGREPLHAGHLSEAESSQKCRG